MGSHILLIVLAILLVAANGFFVAAEFGFVKLRATRVKAIAKKHGWRGRILATVHGNLDAYLSACQLGITLASLGLGWVGEPAFAAIVESVLAACGMHNQSIVQGASFFAAFFAISYLHIVVGELAPKSFAIRMSERVCLWAAVPLYGFYWVMYPAIWVLNSSSNFVLRVTGLATGHGHDSQYSPEELKVILRASRTDERVSSEDLRVLAQALDFKDLQITALMRPFGEAVTLNIEDATAESLEKICAQRYSRYPVMGSDQSVQGVVLLKDIFLAMNRRGNDIDLAELVRPVLTVSSKMSATDVFRQFKKGAPHFAVVLDGVGRPCGFVTMDNLLGALVGEINDEYRQAHNEWMVLDDGSLLGKGSLSLFSLERALGQDIECKEGESVGGLLLSTLRDVPKPGQKVEFPHFDIVVKKMKGPRILLVRVFPH